MVAGAILKPIYRVRLSLRELHVSKSYNCFRFVFMSACREKVAFDKRMLKSHRVSPPETSFGLG